MRYLNKLIIIVSILLNLGNLLADNRIIIYLKHAPENVITQAEQEAHKISLATKIASMQEKTPGKISKKMVKYSIRSNFLPALSGFMAIYGGYLDISDPDGLISFPLRHTTPKLYVAITPRIQLVNIKGNTFSHREFVTDNQNPTKLYVFERKKDTKKNAYWEVKEQQIPADKKINPLVVIFLTHPKNLFVALGDFLSAKTPQLILPEIFVVGRSQNEDTLLQALDLQRYFEQITFEQKKASDFSIQKLITNI